MSDALTDLARDQRREVAYGNFIEYVLEFLRKPTAVNRKKVVTTAEQCDDIPRGYWGSRTNLSKQLNETLESLLSGDRKTWVRLLRTVDNGTKIYNDLKSISPLNNEIFIGVKYGIGFVNLDKPNELQNQIDNHLRNNDLCVYDADLYVIVLEPIKIKEVIWLGNGCYDNYASFETPSTKERKQRQKHKK